MAMTVLALLCILQPILASPAARPNPVLDVEAALITASPDYPPPTRTVNRRGLVSDAESYANSILSGAPSFITDGVANFFQGYPTGDAVLKSAGVSSSDLDALPTQALNIPGYGNWTTSGWNLRVHGNIFKQPNISNDKVNSLANVFLIDTKIEELPPSQSAQAANLTKEIFVVQQGDVHVTVNIEPAPSAGTNGESGGGGAVTPSGGSQQVALPNPTTPEGDFDVFFPLSDQGLADGNNTGPPQRMNVYVDGTEAGNATSYLVTTEGLTIISDIDDILRVTKIYEPKEGLLNSFARPFTQWMNMPDIYANWSKALPETHFHYLTTTPEQVTRNYMDFIYKTYPGGSFDTRPLNFSDVKATLSIRRFLLDKIFLTYPKRKFVLVADTSNSDVMRDYPAMAKDYPGQVQCIFLRNTSATDPGDKFPYDTSGFEGLNQQMYMFFHVPDDLTNLDISSGQCYNASIAQNVTNGLQGLPFGIGNSKKSAGSLVKVSENGLNVLVGTALALVGAVAFSGM